MKTTDYEQWKRTERWMDWIGIGLLLLIIVWWVVVEYLIANYVEK